MTSAFLPPFAGTSKSAIAPPKLEICASRPCTPFRVKSCTVAPLAVVPQSRAVILAASAGAASIIRARQAKSVFTQTKIFLALAWAQVLDSGDAAHLIAFNTSLLQAGLLHAVLSWPCWI